MTSTPLAASKASGTHVQSALFASFARTAESVAETRSRIKKSALVAGLLNELGDADLVTATRYLSGRVFALSDERTTRTGGRALLSALVLITGTEIDGALERLVAVGDLGDLAQELFMASPAVANVSTLTISDVDRCLASLASISGAKERGTLLIDLLRKATPLECKYLVKLLIGDLRIGLQEGAVETAIAMWSHSDLYDVQWANMLLGDIGETALLARRHALDQARMQLFHPVKFMLATPAATTLDIARQMPAQFIVEDKYDGIRAQAHIAPAPDGESHLRGTVVSGRRVAIFSRTLDDITVSFPDLLEPLAQLLGPADLPECGYIVDGEILAMRHGAVVKFRELQSRLGRKRPTQDLIARVPVAFVAFDALYAAGDLMIDRPLRMRRSVLDSLATTSTGFMVAPSRAFDDAALLDAEFESARARGNEGLMVKDPGSSYQPGRRGRQWLKIKRAAATLDVVVTAVEVGHGRRSKVLSDYTFSVRASQTDSQLLVVGKAYSGLTDAEIQELSIWFREHTIAEFGHGSVRIVEPKIVIEVTFDLVQKSKRHKSGYALRFPRIVRIRPDKPVEEIDTLDTVALLAND